MQHYLRLASAAALMTSFTVFAKAQTPNSPSAAIPMAPAASIEAPLVGVLEVVNELRSVSYHRPDGLRTFAIVAEDFAKYFPTAVSETPAGSVIEPGAMAAVLLALVKETQEANAHLSSQLEHVMYDKGELERRLHALEAEMTELREQSRTRDFASAGRKRSRRSAAARN